MKGFKSIGKRLSQRSKGKEVESNTPAAAGPSTFEPVDESLFGLFCLYPQPGHVTSTQVRTRSQQASKAKDSIKQHEVDIVAIHGLGGTPRKTWTHENGKLWLEDFAPEVFPASRIYTFGYDSGFAFSKGTGTLRDFAKNFLVLLGLERATPEVYSFSFIAKSVMVIVIS